MFTSVRARTGLGCSRSWIAAELDTPLTRHRRTVASNRPLTSIHHGTINMRAWARHSEPDKARDLTQAADGLDAARDLAIDLGVATLPKLDA